jgi:hypothetical protein
LLRAAARKEGRDGTSAEDEAERLELPELEACVGCKDKVRVADVDVVVLWAGEG